MKLGNEIFFFILVYYVFLLFIIITHTAYCILHIHIGTKPFFLASFHYIDYYNIIISWPEWYKRVRTIFLNVKVVQSQQQLQQTTSVVVCGVFVFWKRWSNASQRARVCTTTAAAVKAHDLSWLGNNGRWQYVCGPPSHRRRRRLRRTTSLRPLTVVVVG